MTRTVWQRVRADGLRGCTGQPGTAANRRGDNVYRPLIDWLTEAPSAARELRRAPRVLEPKVVVYLLGWLCPGRPSAPRCQPRPERISILPSAGIPAQSSDSFFSAARTMKARPGERSRHLYRPEWSGTGRTAWRSNFSFAMREDRQLLAQLIAGLPGHAPSASVQSSSKNQGRRGQAMIEFALMLPLLFL